MNFCFMQLSITTLGLDLGSKGWCGGTVSEAVTCDDSPIRALIKVLPVPLSVQVPMSVLGKVTEAGSNASAVALLGRHG